MDKKTDIKSKQKMLLLKSSQLRLQLNDESILIKQSLSFADKTFTVVNKLSKCSSILKPVIGLGLTYIALKQKLRGNYGFKIFSFLKATILLNK